MSQVATNNSVFGTFGIGVDVGVLEGLGVAAAVEALAVVGAACGALAED